MSQEIESRNEQTYVEGDKPKLGRKEIWVGSWWEGPVWMGWYIDYDDGVREI